MQIQRPMHIVYTSKYQPHHLYLLEIHVQCYHILEVYFVNLLLPKLSVAAHKTDIMQNKNVCNKYIAYINHASHDKIAMTSCTTHYI